MTTTNTEVPWGGGGGDVTVALPVSLPALCSIREGEPRQGRGPVSPHLVGGDVVSRIQHPAGIAPDALDLGHHRGLDDGVPHLVGFLMEEDPAGTTAAGGDGGDGHPLGPACALPSPPAHPELPEPWGARACQPSGCRASDRCPSPARAPPVAAVTPPGAPGARDPLRHPPWPCCCSRPSWSPSLMLSPSCHPHRRALLAVPTVSPVPGVPGVPGTDTLVTLSPVPPLPHHPAVTRRSCPSHPLLPAPPPRLSPHRHPPTPPPPSPAGCHRQQPPPPRHPADTRSSPPRDVPGEAA